MTITSSNTQQRQSGIFWLASYPKSGNTWTRSFIKAVHNFERLKKRSQLAKKLDHVDADDELNYEGLIDINALNTGAIASDRHWLEQILGFYISDFNQDEIDLMRPDAYRWYAKQVRGIGYHKIHDAYTYLPNGEPLIPVEATLGALCIIRNPFDVAISLANHNGTSIEQSIEDLGNPEYAFCNTPTGIANQVRQWLLNWSDFVNSWDCAKDINKFVVRYEDMKRDQFNTFSKIATFLQLPNDADTISCVLQEIQIDKLKAQEEKSGFKEKSARSPSFFRKGIVGDWQEKLDDIQIQKIIDDHHEAMQKFGYLDANNNPTPLICTD